MPSILDEICAARRASVAERKAAVPLEQLQRRLPGTPARGFERALRATLARGELALIAELKKASPSRGLIRPAFDPAGLAKAYAAGGATCLSILTEERYFKAPIAISRRPAAPSLCPACARIFCSSPTRCSRRG